jgi:hypothetical protein
MQTAHSEQNLYLLDNQRSGTLHALPGSLEVILDEQEKASDCVGIKPLSEYLLTSLL